MQSYPVTILSIPKHGIGQSNSGAAFNSLSSTVMKAWCIFCHFRPENTHKGITASYQLDLNLLYWSEEGKMILPIIALYFACQTYYEMSISII